MILSVIWSAASSMSLNQQAAVKSSVPSHPQHALHPPPMDAAAPVAAQLRHILLETNTHDPAGNQCSPKERFHSSQVSSLIRPKHGKVSACASITKTGRRGHTARILGEDRTASVYTDWWSLPSQAAFSFLTPQGLIIYFHTFPNLNFWEKPLSR